jgi:hypothetical protein
MFELPDVLTLIKAFLGTRLFIIGVSVCLVCAACSEPPKPSGPKFTGRVLLLTGDPSQGAALAELTQAGNGYNLATLTAGVKEATPSPDQTRLLFATKDEISVRDLASGSITGLVKGESVCLAWAPDSSHFSYQQRSGNSTKLYVADMTGKAKLVLDDSNGTTDCARWISKERLVLDRFVGLPTKSGAQPLKPNTSTVATIGETVKLKDTPRKWSIEAVCAKSGEGFVRSADQARLLIAKNMDRFESLDPVPAPCSQCDFIGYAAQSCAPFFIEQPSSTTTELFFLNPTNWQKQRPTSITWIFADAKFLINSSARLMVAGDAPDKLLLIDTESGEVTPFFQTAAAKEIGLVSPVPIVWIEK